MRKVATGIGLVISGLLILPANAQTVYQRQLNQPFQRNEMNPLSGEGINPLDIIHNANFGNLRGMSEFVEDSANGISKAAEDFKRQQQRLILERQRQQQVNTNSSSP
ncbi:MAG: hypothetical protein NZ901_07305 [Geminocystis sp.]|nr:hypothetical protein [Geminocystis sp.]HIK36385.1 hypothetical protein [Geminocystis sp. M7585_C2015_104]MCS7147980.1 hypothetical protein [Geminocystis sp.]MCX8078954.1 hypothetical protein [Geminocystis sp.]MDW8116940.1 hypothetical protein [Geminocystis sp.]